MLFAAKPFFNFVVWEQANSIFWLEIFTYINADLIQEQLM